ncbi:MAG: putative sulfate exporter family transporter, partial [Alistipes sp.]
RHEAGAKGKVSIPWFILLFVLAMIANTYLPLGETFLNGISVVSHKCLSLTLFLIGTGLSIKAIREVGVRPVVLGVALWAIISVVSLLVVVL